MTDPYVPKKAGDVIFADDWNAMQVQMIDHHRLHQHLGDKDGTPRIPRAGIEPRAIDGSLIDPAASIDVTNLNVSGKLDVTGPVTAKGGLNVSSGAVTTKDALTVGGALKANATLDVAGALKAGATLDVKGDVTIGGAKISVPAASQLYSAGRFHLGGEEILYLLNKGGVIIGKEWGGNGDLTVQGNIAANGVISLTGALSAKSSISVDGALKANSTLDVTGALKANSNLDVKGDVSIGGGKISVPNGLQLYSAGRLHLAGEELLYLLNKGGVVIGKDWGGNGDLTVQGNIAANGVISLTGALSAKSSISVDGALKANAALDVKGDVSVAGGTRLNGALSVGGDVAVGGAVLSIPASGKLYSPGRLVIDSREIIYMMPKSSVIIGKWGDSSGNLTVEGALNVGGEVTTGAKINTPGGGQLYCAGTFHLSGEDNLYLLNKKGVIVGKEWGGNGNLSVQGTLTQSSDARLKEEIRTVDGALDKVMALRGVNFRWKSDGKAATGLIAQEVEAVIPDAVQDDPNGMKSVNYSAMIPLLIEAIKDQQAQIDQLRAALAQVNG